MPMPMTCAVDRCWQPARSRGWCDMHYSRWKRHGDTNHAPHGSHNYIDPLTEADYQALQASVGADARRLLPAAFAFIASQVGA